MKTSSKIKVYSVLSWVLFGITLLLAVVYQLIDMSKTDRINLPGFVTEILVQPYFWIALILRWRIKVNKLKQKNG